jgi:hypothetical protein
MFSTWIFDRTEVLFMEYVVVQNRAMIVGPSVLNTLHDPSKRGETPPHLHQNDDNFIGTYLPNARA